MEARLVLWLKLVSTGHITGGLLLPFLMLTGLGESYVAQLHQVFWGGSPETMEAAAFISWIVALFGPTVSAWGVLMFYLVCAGERRSELWPWTALMLSVLAWAPLDIGISLLVPFWPHVYLDVFMVGVIVMPAWLLRRKV